MNEGCCFSNLDSHYLSGYASVVQRQQLLGKSNFPAVANGASYCHLQQAAPESLFGYSDIWYLADSSCIDSYYTCTTGGEFQAFSQPGCAGSPKSLKLKNNSQLFTFESMGNVTGQITTITDGSEIYSWTAYIPSSPSTLAQQYAEIRGCIFNLAAITTVLNTANFIIGFQSITERHIKISIYASIILLHIILAGGNYFTYWYLASGNGSIWQKWIHLVPVWTVLMFIFNTVPSFTIAVPLVKNSEYLRKMSTFSAIKKLLVIDKKFALLVLLQTANTISVLVFYYIQEFTQSLESDRNFLSMSGVLALLYALHTGINCLFIEHIRAILHFGAGYSSSIKSATADLGYSNPLTASSGDNQHINYRVSNLFATPPTAHQYNQ
ncbi:hypothetical protein HDV04_001596 [Boothiomyces sp. JEL0838]|nr:hypothetical protein HDV04_001596 [Boothiomyces sp. JEL0838]